MAEKILTALDIIRKPGGVPLRDVADFEGMNREAQARHGKVGKKVKVKIVAYVNHNRWVADCPYCGAGIGLLPEVSPVTCLECGESYTVTWPKDREAIEEVLTCRPRKSRHWLPHETIDDLKRENEQHIDVLRRTMADEGIDVSPEIAAKALRAIQGGD